jgi:hypothetical protein
MTRKFRRQYCTVSNHALLKSYPPAELSIGLPWICYLPEERVRPAEPVEDREHGWCWRRRWSGRPCGAPPGTCARRTNEN